MVGDACTYTVDRRLLNDKHTGISAAHRPPPSLPAEVRRVLETRKVFTNRTDAEVVASLYRGYFESNAAIASRMTFREQQWGAQEAAQLADALPHFTRLEEARADASSI